MRRPRARDRRLGAAAAALLALCFSPRARAASMTWEFEAVVRENRPVPNEAPPDGNRFFAGQVIRGSLAFETGAVRSGGNGSTTAAYAGAMTGLDLRLLYAAPGVPGESALLFRLNPNGQGNQVWVQNLAAGDLLSYEVPLLLPNPGYSTLGLVQLVLRGPALVGNLGYLAETPEIDLLSPYGTVALFNRYPGPGFILVGRNGVIGAELTMLRVVPEPALFALLAVFGILLPASRRL